jgi:pentatricopeptide repeat protein
MLVGVNKVNKSEVLKVLREEYGRYNGFIDGYVEGAEDSEGEDVWNRMFEHRVEVMIDFELYVEVVLSFVNGG